MTFDIIIEFVFTFILFARCLLSLFILHYAVFNLIDSIVNQVDIVNQIRGFCFCENHIQIVV